MSHTENSYGDFLLLNLIAIHHWNVKHTMMVVISENADLIWLLCNIRDRAKLDQMGNGMTAISKIPLKYWLLLI